MTLSRYRTFVGVALDRNNAQLSAAVSATGTSLPITNINYITTDPLVSSGASYSAIIVDGPLTEVVALTGNLTAGAVGCAALANAHSIYTYVVFQLTASIGPMAYMPLETFDFEDTYDQLYDTANVGSEVRARNAQAGKRMSEFNCGGAVFTDTVGYVLGGIFGSEDVSGGGPYLHKFGVLNVALSGSTLTPGQPVRYIVYDYDAFNTRLFCGRWTEMTLTTDPKQLMKYTAKFMSRASGVAFGSGATPTTSYSGLAPTPAWYAYLNSNGAAIGTALESETTFSRMEPEAIPTASNNQDPWDIFVGGLQIKGKFGAIFDNDTQLDYYFNETQPSLAIVGDGGSPSYGLTTTMTKCNYEKAAPKQQGKSYVTQEIEFEAVGNSTDVTTAGGGSSGYIGVGTVTLANSISGGTNYT